MSAANAAQLLELWERMVEQPGYAREDALLSAAGPVPANIGARNAALVALRARLFGPRWELYSRCPACGESCEFSVDVPALGEQLAANLPDPALRHEVALPEGRVQFRLPEAGDLRVCAQYADRESAASALLERCLIDGPLQALPDTARAAISARMQELDPAALVSFAVRCPSPACAHEWNATLDVGESVQTEIKAAAERVLLEVDALARAYGWNEAEVLALSPARRAAYLQLNGAG